MDSPRHSGWEVHHTGSTRAMQELDGGGVSVILEQTRAGLTPSHGDLA